MTIRSMIAAPIAVLLAVLGLAAVRSNIDVARPALAAPLALRPGLSISTLPARQIHPSAADLREAAMLPAQPMASRQEAGGGLSVAGVPAHDQVLAEAFRPAMPYYAFAPRLLTAKD